jgi:hypothetical protein
LFDPPINAVMQTFAAAFAARREAHRIMYPSEPAEHLRSHRTRHESPALTEMALAAKVT